MQSIRVRRAIQPAHLNCTYRPILTPFLGRRPFLASEAVDSQDTINFNSALTAYTRSSQDRRELQRKISLMSILTAILYTELPYWCILSFHFDINLNLRIVKNIC